MADLTNQLNAALADRYRLERELGRGGMATVFLAEDLKHHRRVAIKVLHPELTAVLGSERFLREIEIAARLQHPHILTLLDSGEARGTLYYVMPYVQGESLREHLGRERQLPVDEALRLAREVADALDYAHRQGVVHRDIKPENILLQADHAVVADFGIARAVREAGGIRLTETGTVLGTPAYMSPEQVIGGGELDGRSDIYSLGCVLYEMLAGVPPFAGATGESLAHQHLSVEAPLITSTRSAVPQLAAQALARALAKTPADRFATAAQFATALAAPTGVSVPKAATRPGRRRWMPVAAAIAAGLALALVAWRFGPSLFRGQPPAPAKKSWILVAAFDGPAEDSSVVKATRELVTTALDQSEIVATVPDDQIGVALENAGKPASTRVDAALARELAYRSAVRVVVEGRVTRLGRRYSVALRLVDADSARVLFAVSDVARDEDDLIPTVGRIAGKLRAELGERRSAIEVNRERDEGFETSSFEAYRRALRARKLIGSGESRAAITVARSALALDPDYADAWYIVGTAFYNLGEPDSALEAFTQARAPAKHGEKDGLYDEAVVAALKGDLPRALASYERAIQLDPLSPGAHSIRGFYLSQAGRWAEALESYRTAEKLSPFGPSQIELSNQFWALLMLGRIDEARQLAPRLTASPYQASPLRLAMAAGDWEAAEGLATVLRSSATHPDVRRRAGRDLAVVQAARGQVQASERTLRQGQSEAEAAEERRWTNDFRWGRLQLALVTQGVAAGLGDAGRWESTTADLTTRGLWSAAAGDTMSARRLLAEVRTRSAADLARQGFGPVMLEGWIAARTGSWQGVLRDLGPAALQGDATGYVLIQSPPMLRWLVAEAYERLDRPDSAAAYFERAIASPPAGGTNISDSRMAFSFGHRRLVLLYARMGRPQEARRHWEIFSSTFTHPDPEMLPLIEEARAALASAEGMAKSARR